MILEKRSGIEMIPYLLRNQIRVHPVYPFLVLPTSLTFEEPHQLWPKEDQVVHQQQNKPRPQPEQELQEQQQQQQHPNLARKVCC